MLTTLLLLSGCGQKPDDSNTSGDDSGTTETTDTETTDTEPAGAHPLCQEPTEDPFPDDLGAFCPMGSNLDLCVSTDSDDCSTNLCLWDAADPAGDRAYCTVRCSPGDTSSCPDGYTCVRDDCEEMPICQRTEVPSDGPATYTMEDQGLFLEDYTLWWIGQDGAGTTTWMNSHGSVFQYTAAGEGTHVDDFEGINGASGLVTDAEVVLFPGNALTEALLRVADGVLEVVELESGLHPRGGVRGEDGTLWYAVRDSFEDDATFLYPFDPATLVATGERVGFSPTSMPAEILPLTEHGFVSICSDGSETYTLCVGHGPDDLVEIPAPPFLTEISTAAVRELRRNPTPDDLWWSSEEGIAHWDGASWTVEDDLRPYENPAGLQPLGDGRAVAFLEAPSGEYDALYLDGTCWQPLQPTGAAYSRTLYNGSWDSSLGEIRPDVVGYATSDNDLVSLSVSAFP